MTGLNGFQKSLRSCIWTKVASALAGLSLNLMISLMVELAPEVCANQLQVPDYIDASYTGSELPLFLIDILSIIYTKPFVCTGKSGIKNE